jgi:hypothetical protein
MPHASANHQSLDMRGTILDQRHSLQEYVLPFPALEPAYQAHGQISWNQSETGTRAGQVLRLRKGSRVKAIVHDTAFCASHPRLQMTLFYGLRDVNQTRSRLRQPSVKPVQPFEMPHMAHTRYACHPGGQNAFSVVAHADVGMEQLDLVRADQTSQGSGPWQHALYEHQYKTSGVVQ